MDRDVVRVPLSVVADLRGERGAALRLLSDLREVVVMVGEDTAGAAEDLESIHDTLRGKFVDGPELPVEVLGRSPLANAVVVSDVDSSITGMPLLNPVGSTGVNGRPASVQADFDRP